MSDKPKLTYFDAPQSRGEECRLALHLGGVDFVDDRIKREQWPALKPTTPFGALPVLEWPGHRPLAQSNAILVLIGRRHGLHPKDDFEAARHEAMLAHAEDLRHHITPTMRMTDEAAKKTAREALTTGYIPTWAAKAETQIADDGPFFAGASIHVVDLKLHMIVKWLKSGALDHIPATVLDGYPKLNGVHDAVRDHAGVKGWYSKKR